MAVLQVGGFIPRGGRFDREDDAQLFRELSREDGRRMPFREHLSEAYLRVQRAVAKKGHSLTNPLAFALKVARRAFRRLTIKERRDRQIQSDADEE